MACASVGALEIACTPRAAAPSRVPAASVTGRATAAVGDSGVFASPVVPYGVHPLLSHADAESAAVAMGYWAAPSVQDLTVAYYHDIPTERRRFCGRSYYVRPVVAMPDTTVVRSMSGNDWMLWAPTWVMPICDAKGQIRTSVHLADMPPGLRVVQGPNPHDVPELVPDSGTFPHIGQWSSEQLREWDHGIGLTPESAVAAAMARLAPAGVHVAEVPEAFTAARLLDPSPPYIPSPRVVGDLAICPRWRLTLDRPVTLRGTASAQVVRTDTVYVTRSNGGCWGAPLLQVPKPSQPETVPFQFLVAQPVPPRSRVRPPAPELRWTTLRVLEPLWFEEARLVSGADPSDARHR
jgi:hypothetical protein